MIKHEDDGYWIEMAETIAAHHDEVFACLTTADGLSRWFPVKAEVDLRTGGSIVFGWNREFTRTTTVKILDYDPGGMIVWDWQVSHGETHVPLHWTVEPSVEQGCRVHVRQGPFNEDAESMVNMADEAQSWCWQLCNLRTALEVGHDMRKVRPL